MIAMLLVMICWIAYFVACVVCICKIDMNECYFNNMEEFKTNIINKRLVTICIACLFSLFLLTSSIVCKLNAYSLFLGMFGGVLIGNLVCGRIVVKRSHCASSLKILYNVTTFLSILIVILCILGMIL